LKHHPVTRNRFEACWRFAIAKTPYKLLSLASFEVRAIYLYVEWRLIALQLLFAENS